ncbi:MFS transporter [Oceanobacillus sp. AG]|uniref:MFS transporter n=1 Tax=Oceanobacillus sp. AG TaxID=2681969 RepID=UPI0012EB43AE|nr:MFS transporter [Oceanobacillus sp. AG]
MEAQKSSAPSQYPGGQKKSNYRWVIMAVIFLTYTVAMADRVNIGVVLPFIREEFAMSNFQLGLISSMFFLGYALTQIPAGFLIGKKGTRGLISISIILFSTITFLIGHARSALQIILLRLFLGISEGVTPVGMTSTINRWFPAKEKGTATGIYIASTQLAPIITPPLATFIALQFGWRYVFYFFAIPGIMLALIWYIFIRTSPEESEKVNQLELDYIRHQEEVVNDHTKRKSLGVIDKAIRYQKVSPITKFKSIFTSWNIAGDTLAYFFMNCVNYGMLTWVPSYLVVAKGFSYGSMGWLASAPAVGGIIGALLGGWISDRLFLKRRKPTMMITAFTTAIMMFIVIYIPSDPLIVGLTLAFAGFFLNIGWPAFTAYPMGLTTGKTYPVAIATINSGGNLGGFFAPIIVGLILDATGNYNFAFGFFGAVLILAFLIICTLKEPVQD